jgi:hypothetical protein
MILKLESQRLNAVNQTLSVRTKKEKILLCQSRQMSKPTLNSGGVSFLSVNSTKAGFLPTTAEEKVNETKNRNEIIL